MCQLPNRVLFLVLFIALWWAPAKVTSTEPTMRSGQEINPWRWKTHVVINNSLGEGLNLTVHCKSKDHDLGTQVIADGGNYEWSFKVNFIKTTLYFCGCNWQDGGGVFDMYRADRDFNRCMQCRWVAQKDGMHGFPQDSDVNDLLYKWEKSPN